MNRAGLPCFLPTHLSSPDARHRPRARDPPGFFARRPRPAPPDVRAGPRPAHRPDRTERSRTAHTHGWRLARDPRPFASPDLHMRVYQRASASHVPRVPRGSLRHALDARAPLPRTRATRVAISAPHGAGVSAPAGSKLKFWRSDLSEISRGSFSFDLIGPTRRNPLQSRHGCDALLSRGGRAVRGGGSRPHGVALP